MWTVENGTYKQERQQTINKQKNVYSRQFFDVYATQHRTKTLPPQLNDTSQPDGIIPSFRHGKKNGFIVPLAYVIDAVAGGSTRLYGSLV